MLRSVPLSARMVMVPNSSPSPDPYAGPDSDPIDDPDVRQRLHQLKPESYPINYPYLNLLKDRMQDEGLFRDDVIALPRFPLQCSSCAAKVVPPGHPAASFKCPDGCGWCYVRRDANAA